MDGNRKPSAPARQLLAASGWTRTLTPEQRERVEQELTERTIASNAYLARRGEPVDCWYGIVEGIVKVSSVTRDGKTMSYAAFTNGAWFGEGSMLWGPGQVRMYDATALRDTHLVCISHHTFGWLMDSGIEFNRYIARHLASRLGQAMSILEHDRLTPPETRLANSLHDLFNPLLNPGTGMRLSITQEEIGYLCGLSRQVVNRVLRQFEELGIIKLEYGVLAVVSLERLRAASRGVWEAKPPPRERRA